MRTQQNGYLADHSGIRRDETSCPGEPWAEKLDDGLFGRRQTTAAETRSPGSSSETCWMGGGRGRGVGGEDADGCFSVSPVRHKALEARRDKKGLKYCLNLLIARKSGVKNNAKNNENPLVFTVVLI